VTRPTLFAIAVTALVGCADPVRPTRPDADALVARTVSGGYSVTDLGTLGGTSSSAIAINENGEIVGWSSTRSGPGHAFFRTADGSMIDIGAFSAQDVNAAGQVVGYRVASTPVGNVAYAVFWSASTGIIEFGEGIARSINDLGEIAGAARNTEGVWRAAFWPSRQTQPVDLGSLGGYSEGQGVNNDGVIAGYSYDAAGVQRAVEWRKVNGNWVMKKLTDSPYTSAFSVNIHGDIAGGGCPDLEPMRCPEHHAFLWPASGGQIALASLGGPRRHAYGINDNGDVVGFANNSSGKQRAVIWPAGGGVTDLGLVRGAYDGEARAINSGGVIVGVVWFNSGRSRAVRWARR
jgi:probable HAF family extracellular repeat protein